MAGAPIETEIKLRVATPEAAHQALLRLGARLETPRSFEDNVLFDDAEGSLAGRGSIVRLRRSAGRALVTFKGARTVVEGVRRAEEVEFSVSDPNGFERLLAALGLRPVFHYQRYRHEYRHANVQIVVDETPIGGFLEIEGPLDAIHRAAAALGYRREDYIVESYAELFFAAGGRGDMVFEK